MGYNKNTLSKFTDQSFCHYMNHGIISLDDVMGASQETIMKSIIDKVHGFPITKIQDGRYLTYVRDESKPHGRRQIKRKSKADLYKFLLGFYDIEDISKDYSSKTYTDLFAEWTDYKKQFVNAVNKKRGLSPSTIRRYERDFEKYIRKSPLANQMITDISSPNLEKMLRDIIRDNDLTDRCAGNLIGYIKQSFVFARRKRYIQEDPAEYIDRSLLLSQCKFIPNKADSDRVLSNHEIVLLKISVDVHLAKHPLYMPDYAIKLAFLTGMRVGELSVLTWKCITDDFILIDASEHRLDYSDRPCDLVIDEPKNGKHRKIPLTPEIRTFLEKLKTLDTYDPTGFLFCRKDGSRYTGHDISCATTRRGKEVGINNVSIHQIRRTVSSLLNTILPQKVVAEMLGHTEKVNERHYNYSLAENNEKIKALSMISKISCQSEKTI